MDENERRQAVLAQAEAALVRAELSAALAGANCLDVGEGLLLADKSRIKLADDGTVSGIAEVIAVLRADRANLFEAKPKSTLDMTDTEYRHSKLQRKRLGYRIIRNGTTPAAPPPVEGPSALDMSHADYMAARRGLTGRSNRHVDSGRGPPGSTAPGDPKAKTRVEQLNMRRRSSW